MPDPALVLKFLAGYTPRFLCVPCLAVLMVREESEVVPVIAACVINGAVETRIDGEFCLNCLKLTYAVRINRHAGPDAVLTLTADERR